MPCSAGWAARNSSFCCAGVIAREAHAFAERLRARFAATAVEWNGLTFRGDTELRRGNREFGHSRRCRAPNAMSVFRPSQPYRPYRSDMHALDRRELRDTSFSVKLRCEIFLWRRRHDCVRPDARGAPPPLPRLDAPGPRQVDFKTARPRTVML